MLGRYHDILLQRAGAVTAGIMLCVAESLIPLADCTITTRLVNPFDADALADTPGKSPGFGNRAANLDDMTNTLMAGDFYIHGVRARYVVDVGVAASTRGKDKK